MNPESLFKYVPFCAPKVAVDSDLQKKRVKGFEKGEIWYPKANTLNDPYECYPDFDTRDEDIDQIVESLTPEEFIFIKEKNQIESKEKLIKALKTPNAIKIPNGSIRSMIPFEFIHRTLFLAAISAISSHYLSTIGVLSLTEDPLNLRMWAHYGGNSKGICIEFERNHENLLGSTSTKPVIYRKIREKIPYYERHLRKEEIITTKFEAWSGEKEWRHWRNQGDKLYPYPGKILRVIFGLNCHPSTIEIAKDIFTKDVLYEEIILGNDYSLSTDKGLKESLSKIKIKWP